MVPIPKGTFQMGSNKGHSDEKPVHSVTVEAFCMDRTEVTVAAYANCVAEKKCIPAPTTVQSDASNVEFWSQFCNANRAGRKSHPINCIDWTMSTAYCAAVGKRLPTEEEWEYAARGTDGRTYPWPNEKGKPSKGLLNACDDECVALGHEKSHTLKKMFDGDDGFRDTAPADSFHDGASPFGVLNMAGNVAEWTSSPSTVDYSDNDNPNDAYVSRGGGWPQDAIFEVRATSCQTRRRRFWMHCKRRRYCGPKSINGRGILNWDTIGWRRRCSNGGPSGEERKRIVLKGHSGAVIMAAWSPDGQSIVTSSKDKTARIWKWDGSGKPIVLEGHSEAVNSAAWSPDSKQVLTSSEDGAVRTWVVDVSSLQQSIHNSTIDCLTQSQRETYLLESASDGQTRYEACERKYGRTPLSSIKN